MKINYSRANQNLQSFECTMPSSLPSHCFACTENYIEARKEVKTICYSGFQLSVVKQPNLSL